MMNRLFTLLLLTLPFRTLAQGMDLMMQAWYWDYFQSGAFGTWVNQLNTKTTELNNAGFNYIWLPPLPRTSTPNNQTNGYNPKDLYDFGETFGGGACAWGTRAHLNSLISNYNANGMHAVSDVVYNHRDGGSPERNDAVKAYIEQGQTSAPYPSDRFFCVLPLGSANPGANGSGDYYFKIRSRTQNYGSTHQYKLYARTSLTAYNPTVLNESEPNGGGDCGQAHNILPLGQDMNAALGANGGCHIDEFKITLTNSNFNTTDDTLWLYMTNTAGGYSDHYVYGLWSAPRMADIKSEVQYWTYTDYTNMPSGLGEMNYNGFRPNDNTELTETLGCDWNCPLFFYDYDQDQTVTQTVLNEWTKWQINTVGIDGLRMDAVKHFSPDFVSQLFNYLATQGAMPELAVGEAYDFDAGYLNNWVETVYAGMSTSAKAQLTPRVFDFALRGALKNACDQFGYDVRNVFTSGVVDGAGGDPFKVITFLNNHDFRDAGQPIQNDCYLAYAYILTNNQVGMPCVFYPDYYGISIPNAPVNNYKSRIDALVDAHNTFIYGSPEADYLSKIGTGEYQSFLQGYANTTLIYQLKPATTGGKNVIMAINFSGTPLDVYQGVNQSWGIQPGDIFGDVLGYATVQTTTIVGPSNDPQIHIQMPARSYAMFVQDEVAPIELSEFDLREDHDFVKLWWKTAHDRKFERFEVERSDNSRLDFITVGETSGNESSVGGQFEFTDQFAPHNQLLYYRLKMIDSDGAVFYSAIRNITLERKSFSTLLSPNPSKGAAVLFIQSQTEQTLSIDIIDALGKQVFSRQIEASPNAPFECQLPDQLLSGIYTISIKTSGEAEQKQWIVR